MKKLALLLLLAVLLVCGAAFTRLGVEPSPFTPFVSQMGAIDNQLSHVKSRVTDVVASVITFGLGSDPDNELALSRVLLATRQTLHTLQLNSTIWAHLLPVEAQTILMQVTAGIDAITAVFEPYNPILATPTALCVVDESLAFELELNWDPVVNATGYEAQWSSSSTGPWQAFAATVTQAKAFDMPDPWDQYRFYRVRAYRAYGTAEWTSAWTDPVGGTLNHAEVPSNFGAVSTSASIAVHWNATVAASGYQIDVVLADVLYRYTQTTNTAVTVIDLTPDTDYYVSVCAFQDPTAGVAGDTEFGPSTPPLYVRTKPSD